MAKFSDSVFSYDLRRSKAQIYIKEDEKVKKNRDENIEKRFPWTVIGSFSTYNEAAERGDEERAPNSDYDYKKIIKKSPVRAL